jgi:hypothetical protein
MTTLRLLRRALGPALALAAFCAPALAQEPGTIDLTLTDSATQAPVTGARVATMGLGFTPLTDATGRARLLDLAAGEHVVQVTHVGYATRTATVRVAAGETSVVRLALVPTAVTLDPMRVEGRSLRLQEFYQRAQAGGRGYFITREQIERRRARRFSDVLQGIPGVQVTPAPGGRNRVRLGRTPDVRDCPPVFYLDGVRFEGSNLDADLRPEFVEGVEVYPSGQAPARFPAYNAGCGVVLVWTRDKL